MICTKIVFLALAIRHIVMYLFNFKRKCLIPWLLTTRRISYISASWTRIHTRKYCIYVCVCVCVYVCTCKAITKNVIGIYMNIYIKIIHEHITIILYTHTHTHTHIQTFYPTLFVPVPIFFFSLQMRIIIWNITQDKIWNTLTT